MCVCSQGGERGVGVCLWSRTKGMCACACACVKEDSQFCNLNRDLTCSVGIRQPLSLSLTAHTRLWSRARAPHPVRAHALELTSSRACADDYALMYVEKNC